MDQSTSEEPILQTQDLVKRYGDHYALDKVSLSIPKGSIFGLLGPNGAGKTTLIRMMTQITAPDSGTIRFDGKALSPSDISRIGYLPEERGLYKKAKIGEQLLYFARLKGMSQAEALEKTKKWFIRLDIKDWWNKPLEELSKGMAQKVQFIATVLHEPEFIILDEPFSGFDPVNSDVIRDEILRLHSEGATILFSTHRMDTVEELCSHVVLIDKAKKVLDGSTREIRNQFRTHRFLVDTREEIDFTNFPWQPETMNEALDGFYRSSFHLVDGQSPNELVADVIQNGELLAFREEMPSFHDIFVQVVTRKPETL
jgi:ABC-2 type transport system ATP-binding protein